MSTFRIRTPPYTTWQAGSFQFRMQIPKDLQDSFTVTAFKVSLRTSFIAEARRKAFRLSSELSTVFQVLRDRGDTIMGKLTPEQKTRLIRTWIQEMLKLDEQRRITGRPETLRWSEDVSPRGIHTALEAVQFALSSQGSLEAWRHIATDGAKALFKVKLKPAEYAPEAEDSFNEPEVIRENDQAEIDELSHSLAIAESSVVLPRMLKRSEGDYSEEGKEILLDDVPLPQRDTSTTNTKNQKGKTEEPAKQAPKLQDVINEYSNEKLSNGTWKKDGKTSQNIRIILNEFCQLAGNPTVDELNLDLIKKLRNVYRVVPKGWIRKKEYQNFTADDFLKHAKDIPEGPQIAASSLKEKETQIKTFLKQARKDGAPLVTGLEDALTLVNAKAVEKGTKAGFNKQELEKLFSPENYNHMPKGQYGNAYYWFPLIALTTGMRVGEIQTLTVEDVKQDEGIDYFDLNEKTKSKKNRNSVRKIPVPVQLLELGFMDFVEAQRKRKSKYLLSDNAAVPASETFTKQLKRLNLTENTEGKKLTFHSFRHTFTTVALQQIEPSLPSVQVKQILGHRKGDSVTENTYTDNAPVKALYENVTTKIIFPIDLMPLKRDWN